MARSRSGCGIRRGGFGPSPLAQIDVRTDIHSKFGVSVGGVLPLLASRFSRTEGDARLLWYGATAGAHVVLPIDDVWFTNIGARGGVLMLNIQGLPGEGFEGSRDRVFTATGQFEISVGRRVADWLRLRLHALAGLTMPRPVVRFDEREVATVGRFYGAVGLSIEGGIHFFSEQDP